MANHQLGHCTEARRWLNRLQSYRANEDFDASWDELEIRLLRSEAEACPLRPRLPIRPVRGERSGPQRGIRSRDGERCDSFALPRRHYPGASREIPARVIGVSSFCSPSLRLRHAGVYRARAGVSRLALMVSVYFILQASACGTLRSTDAGRVDLGGRPPRPPTDPDLPVEDAAGSSSYDFATPPTKPRTTRRGEDCIASPDERIWATLLACLGEAETVRRS